MKKYTAIFEEVQSFINESLFLTTPVSNSAIHCSHKPSEHPSTGCPVVPPISLSTTFVQPYPNNPVKYDYIRAGNYTRQVLEETIASMEEAKYCCSFSSGLATISAVNNLFEPGDHIIYFNDVYGGTNRFFVKVSNKFKIESEALDLQDCELFKSKLRKETKMIWIETPSNPLMRLVDIEAVVKIAKSYNKDIIVAVDNTFLTPVFQRPMNLGVDLVMHSLTKYMNGHSDVLMGAVVMNDVKIFEALQQQQLMVGAVPSPFDCYLALRGMRTLVVRMRQHQFNGLAVALYLRKHPKIDRVLHPAFMDQEIVRKQMYGYSGMLSVYVKADKDSTIKVLQSLKYFQLGESLGGFESLAELPSLMTHASIPEERRKKLGIDDNMIRLSVGLENPVSLLDDLEQALEKI